MKYNLSFLDKRECDRILPRLFEILYQNMSVIAPTGESYEEDRAEWLAAVSPAMQKEPRQIILMHDREHLAGYFQYYVNNGTLMVEEIQIAPQYQQTGALLRLCLSALLAALSIVLGKYLSISTPLFRLSFENLPILMAGIFLGPLAGGIVGGVADLLGCVLVGYTINPIITLGGILVGVLSGLVALLAKPLSGHLDHSPSTPRPLAIWCAVGVAHIVGSMLVKSIGLSVYYGAPLSTLVWRVPLYIVVGAAEGTVLVLLARNKLFTGELNRARSKKERGSRT